MRQALVRVDTTNPPGRETAAAVLLRDHLKPPASTCELVARDPDRANLVARIPGSGDGPRWLRRAPRRGAGRAARLDPSAVRRCVDDDGYLFGRGAVDMKNELAARVVAMARLARDGFRPRGDLWLLAVADEEDGSADVGMRWLLEHRPDIRPDFALNEGDGLRLELTDGRAVMGIAVGDKGTYPARVTAIGEAAHASMPEQGRNAVPLLAELLRRVGSGLPDPHRHPVVDRMVAGPHRPARAGRRRRLPLGPRDGRRHAPGARAPRPRPRRHHDGADDAHRVEQAQRDAGPGQRRARLPDPAGHRPRPTSSGRCGRGSATTCPTSWTGRSSSSRAAAHLPDGPLFDVCQSFLDIGRPGHGAAAVVVDRLHRLGATCARPAAPSPTASARRSRLRPTWRAGFHADDERLHVDDLALAVRFHEQVARALLG